VAQCAYSPTCNNPALIWPECEYHRKTRLGLFDRPARPAPSSAIDRMFAYSDGVIEPWERTIKDWPNDGALGSLTVSQTPGAKRERERRRLRQVVNALG